MKELTVSHDIACDAPRFWGLIFDPKFNAAFYLTALGFHRYEIQRSEDTPTHLRQVIYAEPPLPAYIPDAVRSLLSNLSYQERGTFTKADQSYVFRATPHALSAVTEGVMRVELCGEGRVRREVRVRVDVEAWGLGSVIEDILVENMKESYAAAARFTSEWVQRAGA